MRLFNKYVFIFFLIRFLVADNCLWGCLSCNTQTSDCIFCDATSGFYLSSGACVYQNIDNCAVIRQDGTGCYQCQNGYQISNGVCQQISSSQQNHLGTGYGNSRQNLTGVLFQDILIVAQQTQIQNCKIQTSNNQCDVCHNGFFLNSAKTKCLENKHENLYNCFQIEETDCLECAQNYIKNLNGFMPDLKTEVLAPGSQNLNLAAFNIFKIANNLQTIQNPTCNVVSLQSNSCAQRNSQNVCIQCQPGFYLDGNNACQVNDYIHQSNCIKYDKNKQCSLCAASFYLGIDLQCHSVTSPISNCLYYSYGTTYNTVQCVQCNSAYFLNSGSCSQWTSFPIANCQTYNLSSDQCLLCNTNYFFYNSQYTSCYQTIQNCQTYSLQSNQIQCTQCDDGFYVNNSQCQAITTPQNCITYNSQNQCTRCSGGFYLQGNSCIQSPLYLNQTNCSILNSSDQQSCQTCKNQFQLFTIQSSCQTVSTVVTGCSTYNSSGVCTACNSSYYLNNSNQCVALTYSSTLNCFVNSNTTQCAQCLPNYTLNGQNLCDHEDETIEYNCQSIGSSSGTNYCSQCKEGFLHTNINNYWTFCQLKSTSQFQSSTFNVCQSFNGDDQLCVECSQNQVINQISSISQNQCINASSCTSGILLNILNVQNSIFYPQQKNVCYDSNGNSFSNSSYFTYTQISSQIVQNCQYYGVQSGQTLQQNQDVNYVCTKCMSGFVPVFDPTSNAYKYHIYDQGNSSSDFQNQQTIITSCVSQTIVNQSATDYSLDISNCDIFMHETITGNIQNSNPDLYGCFKCKFGFSGFPYQFQTKFYIEKCSQILGCDNNTIYQGIGNLQNQQPDSANSLQFPKFPINTLLTCHKCNYENTIPFYATNFQQVVINNVTYSQNLYMPYNLQSTSFQMIDLIPSANNRTVAQCLNIETIQQMDPSNNFPQNCAAGTILIDRKFSIFSGNNSSLLCIACQPLYKAVQFSLNDVNFDGSSTNQIQFAVKQCIWIPYCLQSNRFNGCDLCIQGFSLLWDSTNQQPDFSVCVQSITNCLYMNLNGSCQACQKGFVTSIDGTCQQAEINNCDSDQLSLFINFYLPSNNQIDYPLFLFQQNYNECQKCGTDFFKIQKISSSNQTCMKDNWVSQRQNPSFGKNILNCLKISSQMSGLTLSSTNPKVICLQCQFGYLLNQAQDKCVPYWFLPNCSQPTDFLTCAVCNEGSYLVNNQCIKGNIQNCSVYSNATTCQTCKVNYVLQSNKCFYVSSLQCQTIQNNSGTLSCSSCLYNHQIAQTVSKDICSQYGNVVSNCTGYDQQGNCSSCLNNYYLDLWLKFCILRTQDYTNCQTQNSNQDICDVCNINYIYDKVSGKCVSISLSQSNCLQYNAQGNCIQCDKYYALINHICQAVPLNNQIQNCAYYSSLSTSSNYVCQQCESEFALNNNQCIATNLKNCLALLDSQNCQQCLQNFVLTNLNGFDVCVQSSLENCYQQNPVLGCLICNFGFALDNQNKCQPLQNMISNCAIQMNERICQQCQVNYKLSEDRRNCIYIPNNVNTDVNCKAQIKLKQKQCSICNPGYFLNNKQECQLCQTGEGCLFCDVNQSNSCLICQKGYYMNSVGVCVLWDLSLVSNEQTFDSTNGINIKKLLLLILLLFV